MGIFDKLKGLVGGGGGGDASGGKLGGVKDMATKHGDKISDGVDKATDKIDDLTKGKFSDKLDKVDDAVEKMVDKADGDDEAS